VFACKVSAFFVVDGAFNQLDEVCFERVTDEFSEVGEVLVSCMEYFGFVGVRLIFERWGILAVGLEDVVVHQLEDGVLIYICWREKIGLVIGEGHDVCPGVTVVGELSVAERAGRPEFVF
jgi:hypothetical protein